MSDLIKEFTFEEIVDALEGVKISQDLARHLTDDWPDEYAASLKMEVDKFEYDYKNKPEGYEDEWFPDLDKLYWGLSKLKNQIVVDLGAGDDVNMYDLVLRRFGIKGYIAVEPFNHERLESIFEGMGGLPELVHAPFKVIPADMNAALRALPDNSVSIITSGTDDCILQGYYEKDNSKYIDEANELIAKKLHPNGVFVGYKTIINPAKLSLFFGRGHKKLSQDFNVYTK